MNSPLSASSVSSCSFSRLNRLRGLSLCLAACALSSALFGQADPAAADNQNQNGRQRRGQNGGPGGPGGQGGGRGNFSPEEMQARLTAMQREQYGVTDDAEWQLISDRIAAVTELRRATLASAVGGMRGAFGGGGGPGGGGRGRGGAGANPEQTALQQAITDKLPDAEVKSRLERLREVRKANEEKLTKAQEELRALLTVRQEAVAVMSGLLP